MTILIILMLANLVWLAFITVKLNHILCALGHGGEGLNEAQENELAKGLHVASAELKQSVENQSKGE